VNVHQGQPITVRGMPLGQSEAVAVMMHGRNHSPEIILELAERIDLASFTYLAPAAANNTWYPSGFMDKFEANEPYLSYALEVYDQLVADLVSQGYTREKIVLLGFSQGACLTAEYAVRHAACYGGVILFTGGLIGPPGTQWDYAGSFQGTPIFLGSSDVDAWVPLERVQQSTAVFKKMGAEVTQRIYPGMDHLVNDDEIAVAREIMKRVAGLN
jgi:predicted esterase